jgi:Transposase
MSPDFTDSTGGPASVRYLHTMFLRGSYFMAADIDRSRLGRGNKSRRSSTRQSEIIATIGASGRLRTLGAKRFMFAHEASTRVSVAEICRIAAVSPRTFYRWRGRFGGLNLPALMQMNDLAPENLRLRRLVGSLLRSVSETRE